MGTRPPTRHRLEVIRNLLNAARESWGETGETMLDTGQSFAPDEPVRIFIRKRGRSYNLGIAAERRNWQGSRAGGSRSLSAWRPRRDST